MNTHDAIQSAMSKVVVALENAGVEPCDALRIANEAMQSCWQVWNQQESIIIGLRARLAEARER